ncbi:MAG: hypothetical protein IH988_04435, partial [Planctomycetes bacterium]|nr:hypothetical protein [Planctomycetota bacterium]
MLILLARLETGDTRGEGDTDIRIPIPRDSRNGYLSAVFQAGTAALLRLCSSHRQIELVEATRKQQPPVIGHDDNLVPSGIEKFPDSLGDTVDLFSEVVDQPDTDIVATVIDLAGFGPRRSRGVPRFVCGEHLESAFLHQRAVDLDACFGTRARTSGVQIRSR